MFSDSHTSTLSNGLRVRFRRVMNSDQQRVQILIVRHAESEANLSGVLAGRIDPTPLTRKGKNAARALKPILELFDPQAVFVSPMLRCRQTASLAGYQDFIIDDRLLEMDYGSWSGRKLKMLSRRKEWKSIQQSPTTFEFPKGESFRNASERINDFINSALDGSLTRITLFTHGDIARIMINQMMGRELNDFQKIMIEPGSHSLLVADRRDWRSSMTIGYLNRLPESIATRRGPTDFQVGGE